MPNPRNSMNTEAINKFSLEIEELVYMKDISYVEAVVEYCEDNGIEIESAAKLVSGVLKSKIQLEGEELHLLPKSNTIKLPI
jgi:hypothetical protein